MGCAMHYPRTNCVPGSVSPGLVSVILPAYNRPQFLACAIRSVLEQTYRPVELIVVDDGSTEPLEPIVRSVAPEARYIRQPNGGDAAARNRGLDEAHGEWIAFQDSDDVWHPEKLACQIQMLRSDPDVGIVCTAKRAIDETGRVVGGQWKRMHSGWVVEPLFLSVFVTTPSVVMRRSLADTVGRFDTSVRLNSDYHYWLRASLVAKLASIDRPLVDVRQSADRLTSSRSEAAVSQYRVLADFYENWGGHDVVRPKIAARAMANAAYRAGRELRRERRWEESEALFARSLGWRFTSRAALGWLAIRWRRLGWLPRPTWQVLHDSSSSEPAQTPASAEPVPAASQTSRKRAG
jgi:glycosyltransferase involved in cell wall biosynthesis